MTHARRLLAALLGAALVCSIAGSSTTAGALSPPSRTDAPLPARPYAPHTLLVAFEPGVTDLARAALHRAVGASVASNLGFADIDVVRLPSGLDPLTAAKAYGASALVDYAEPDYVFTLSSTPNDPSFSSMYGLDKINAPEGWDLAYGPGVFPSTGGVRVGVVDTGIDRNHTELSAKVKACAQALLNLGILQNGQCGDDHGHGTHTAGTIAAATNNGVGVAGVAPNADLAICKALNVAGSGFTSDIVKCINWLRTTGGARIISMSIGGGTTTTLNNELTAASRAGVLLIAAAGNDGDGTLNYPAAHPDVVSVAATDRNDAKASFSNCNADVEIAAPGVDILSTVPGGYGTMSGTSMATPHVSGVAAVVMAQKSLTAAQTRSLLTSTADELGAAGRDTCFGYGRVNLARAAA